MQIENPQETIFYAIEKAIKTYRQFAQRNINAKNIDITVDQLLVLRAIDDFPGISQTSISKMVFKDFASITRMIELMVRRGYLERTYHQQDRRRHALNVTKLGKSVLRRLNKIVAKNREVALSGLSQEVQDELRTHLEKISMNCTAATTPMNQPIPTVSH